MLTSAVAFVAALVASAILTPLIRGAATERGLLDEPDERKVHEVAIPRLGGVAIGGALFVGVAAALLVATRVEPALTILSGDLPAILLATALIAGVGIIDDLQGMRARVKLAAQVGIALVAVAMGLSLDRLDGPWGSVSLGAWSAPLTVAWIVAVINAVNLIDGLDGLASGVALTAMAALFAIGSAGGAAPPYLIVLAAGAGGVIGFLRFNLHPASIIMGDTGAMLLGFVIAAVGVSVTQATPAGAPPWVPVIAVGLPLSDTAWAILRRLAAGEPIFVPDKRHIHHQLLAAGLSQRAAMVVLWAVSALLGMVAVILAR
jgi:UDP-GlcNAc:undecaprenyl-phosphate/decaprenyl-phosphate GlcNAc-1-phosphate transferase